MESLEQASKVAALTDGPDGVCLMDVHLMREIIAQMKKAEPLKEEMLIYMTQGYGLSYTEACYNYKRLRTDYSIFVEFASRVRNGEYPPMGLKEVAGYTAKRLEEEKGLNPLEAYNALITLKENPKAEIAAGKSSAASADAQNTSEDITDTNSDKNTSFFFHYIVLFLAHCTAHNIRTPKAVPCKFADNLHYLLLEHNATVGIF